MTAPAIIPDTTDDLLDQRRMSDNLASIADFVGLVRHAWMQRRWSERLDAHIARRNAA